MMLVDAGHHLGDAWFHVEPSGTVHAFYLRCPDDIPRHTVWEIAHATSVDLRAWQLHGTVIERSEPASGCLATGSVIEVADGFLMAFTAGWDRPRPAIHLATSPDLFTWTPHPGNPVSVADPGCVRDRPWGGRPPTHWRDPFLRRRGDGQLEMLVCAARPGVPADRSGSIAVLRQDRSGGWSPAPPLDVEPTARELECPQVCQVEDRWFLVFSTWPALFADELRSTLGDQLRPGAYAMAGDGPDGPFRLRSATPIVSPESPVQPYAAQLLDVAGEVVLIGTLWNDDGPDALSDPLPVTREGDRLVAASPVR